MSSSENLLKIIKFMHIVENLKSTIRFTKTRTNVDETVAAHTRRLALLFMMIQEELKLKIDVLHTIKLILIHDIGEVEIGDYDARSISKDTALKMKKEQWEKAMLLKLKKILPMKLGNEIYNLWQEYEKWQTTEANVARVLDKLEASLQFVLHIWHNACDRRDPDAIDHMWVYSNEQLSKVPQLKELWKLIKQELKKSYKVQWRKWKKEYEL